MSEENSVVPGEMLDDLRDAIYNPKQFKYSSVVVNERTIIPSLGVEAFEKFHNRVVGTAIARGAYDALLYLNIYIIRKYQLWRSAPFSAMDDYLDSLEQLGYGISKSSAYSKMDDIDRWLESKTSLENIIIMLSRFPMAGRRLNFVPPEKLPDGNMNAAVEMMAEMGPVEAGRAVSDWADEPSFRCFDEKYDEDERTITFKIKTRPPQLRGPSYEREYVIEDVDQPEAGFIISKLTSKKYWGIDRRQFNNKK